MTKLEAVRMAISMMEGARLSCSKDRYGMIPLEYCEERWQQLDAAIKELKETAQALQAELVRKSIAAWQEDIMIQQENGPVVVDMTDLDPGGGDQAEAAQA